MVLTPVALIVFNRPATTKRVVEAVLRAKPPRVFVIADGPRNPAEVVLCDEVLAIVRAADWECEVTFDIAASNLGAGERVSSGISGVFDHVEEVIILEDDCLPDPTFFRFCDELLDRYRSTPAVMMISGANYLQQWKPDAASYHFSLFGSIWGWATWKRSWALYDRQMTSWSDPATRVRIRQLINDDTVYDLQAARFDRLAGDPADRHSWDLPWAFNRLDHAGLAVVPAVNLIDNLGNADGLGSPPDHPISRLTPEPIVFPLTAPATVAADHDYDVRHVHQMFDYFRPSQAVPQSQGWGSWLRRGMRKARALTRR